MPPSARGSQAKQTALEKERIDVSPQLSASDAVKSDAISSDVFYLSAAHRLLQTDDIADVSGVASTVLFVGNTETNEAYPSSFFLYGEAGTTYMTLIEGTNFIYFAGNNNGFIFNITTTEFDVLDSYRSDYFYAEQVQIGFSYGVCGENITHYTGIIDPTDSDTFSDECGVSGG